MKTKILRISGITLLVISAFVAAAPWLFKGKIIQMAKARFDRNLRAHVYFADAEISLFKNFPKITIALDSLQVTCVGEFQGDTLMMSKQVDFTCSLQSLVAGDSIRIQTITLTEPRFQTIIHSNGHANWNIAKPDADPNEKIDSAKRPINWSISRYAIHKGILDYQDDRRNIHVQVSNLEQEGRGNFSSELFTLKTKTTADAVRLDCNGSIPYELTAKASIDLVLHVDQKTHTFSFNTDNIFFNDLKLHSEGFFQWINDSSYNMNLRFKTPSTKFKDVLSMFPSVYQHDFAHIESNGQVNFNGFIKGKYDEKHFPAYHANFYVVNGYFKYPDLQIPIEHIHLGIQVDNPDGIADHRTINISQAHAEIYHDTLDMHLLVKNPETRPTIDFALVGKLDFANLSQCVKLEPGTKWAGLAIANIHAKGKISETEKKKKDPFTSWGDFYLADFSYSSKTSPGGFTLPEVILAFNSKNAVIQELKGTWLKTQVNASGNLDNLFEFAFSNKPLKAELDLKADEFSLTQIARPFVVPDNINFTINAECGKLHYDNLDLQNFAGELVLSDQTVQLHHVKANGLDGEIVIDGTYSTLESRENPEIALTYDVKGLDIQKAFFGFNSARRIMPVAKFMSGDINAHMTLNGKLNNDMTTDLASLQGEGTVWLLNGTLKDFGPLDKLSQSLDIAALKNIPMKDVRSDFTFKSGRVTVSPFLVHAKEMDIQIGGTHGFDLSLDYNVYLKVPRSQLGSKGSVFVKNVVTQAAEKGIPVKLKETVLMNAKMDGTINSPEIKENMDSTVNTAATDLKKEVDDFVNAKLDSAKQQLRKAPAAEKKQLFVQAGYKSKANVKAKKSSKSAHQKTAHSKTNKKKKKKTSSRYTASAKRARSTASSGKKNSY